MEIRVLQEYRLGDMIAQYRINQEEAVGLTLLPVSMPMTEEKRAENNKNEKIDSLVQLKLAGDIYDEAYALGNSMRNSESVRRLKYKKQQVKKEEGKTVIQTILETAGMYRISHYLVWKENAPYVRMFCQIENTGKEAFSLEMFESFSLSGLSPYLAGDGYHRMQVHRIRSVWSQEGRLETIPLEDMQLEPAWDPHAVRCEKFGQAGSMPVNKFFPFAAVEDTENHVFWGAQIAHPASWQMELYRKDDGLAVSGGLADRDFGHWMKTIRPGQEFATPEAIVTVAQTESFDIFTGRLTESAMEGIAKVPETERDLPIVFNEYCTTWGSPSHENICNILECIKGKGFQYFVIDCGWYRKGDVPWDISMGDYEPSKELFPEGMEKTVEKIKEAGLIPGIWFEIENVGEASKAWKLEEPVICQDDSCQRIAYSIINTFLGRMCISGDVANLSKEQWDMIDSGMCFYRHIAPVIKSGQSYRFGPKIKSARHPKGWQALLRVGTCGQAYLLIHIFEHKDLPEEIRIPLPEGCPGKAADIYSEQPEQVEIREHCLYYTAKKSDKAVAVWLTA